MSASLTYLLAVWLRVGLVGVNDVWSLANETEMHDGIGLLLGRIVSDIITQLDAMQGRVMDSLTVATYRVMISSQ